MKLAVVPALERRRRSITPYVVAALALAALIAIALGRGGLLGLPPAPRGIRAETAGLANLAGLAARARALEAAAAQAGAAPAPGATAQAGGGAEPARGDAAPSAHPTPLRAPGSAGFPKLASVGGAVGAGGDAALGFAGSGLAALRRGDVAAGLESMRGALALAPHDLVLGNAFRMEVFRLKRAALADVAHRQTLAAELPQTIAREPIATFERLAREHPSREVTLQLALAWVDEMLLFPALEIKAPASVESVRLLSELLAHEPAYVPALYARGLNYLHRPARLVWPEAQAAARDAASRDLGACVAIGRAIGGGSPRLIATLALTLGDAYAKQGAPERARSWWQVAKHSSADREVADAVRRRLSWGNVELIDRLEADLENRMLDLDRPLTDLSIVWAGGS